MTREVTFEADGRTLQGPEHAPLLDLLRQNGIHVPSFCHQAGLTPYGACRLCLVEVTRNGRTRLTTSCNFPVLSGIKVETRSDRVVRARRLVLSLLLTRAPRDPSLLSLASEFGADPELLPTKPEPDGCILCGLCVRVCSEVVGRDALTFVGRGVGRRVGTAYQELPESCIGCGACAALCPTSVINISATTCDRFRGFEGGRRLCRYALMGLYPTALCARNYQCESCEVEHRFAMGRLTHGAFLAAGMETDPEKQFIERMKRAGR